LALGEVDQEMQCPICLSFDEPLWHWVCGHGAHVQCLYNHYHPQMPCPVCRQTGFVKTRLEFILAGALHPMRTAFPFDESDEDGDEDHDTRASQPIVPRYVIPLCCPRLACVMEQDEPVFHSCADRRMVWMPSVIENRWLLEWVCLQCQRIVLPMSFEMALPHPPPPCPLGLHLCRAMMVDFANQNHRSWCCTCHVTDASVDVDPFCGFEDVPIDLIHVSASSTAVAE
jgi:hypothetical protein